MGNTTALPFEIGDEIQASQANSSKYWSIYEGKSTIKGENVGENVTVFKCIKKDNASYIECAQRGSQKLRSLKHPHILSFVDGTELDDSIVMATESAIPLSKWIKKFLNHSDNKVDADEIVWGFRCILDGLQFIHRTAKLLHGNISMDSIFITSGGDWKLGLFDIACDVNTDEKFFSNFQHLQPDEFKCPERKNGSWQPLFTGTQYAPIDVYSLGEVFRTIFNRLDLDTPSQLEQYIKKTKTIEPKRRPTTAQMLRCSVFNNEYCKMMSRIGELVLKSSEEAVLLLDELNHTSTGSATSLSTSVCSYKVLPVIGRLLGLSASEFSNRSLRDSCRKTVDVCVAFLDMSIDNDRVEQEAFEKHAMSSVLDLWAISDRSLRTRLLKSLKLTIRLLSAEAINKRLFDYMLIGFTDNSPVMREETLKGLVHILDKLEETLLNDKLVKCVMNLQNDVEPSIRTNAVIFLGRTITKMKPVVQTRIVCNSFVKGVKDGFLHCRLSSMKALVANLSCLDSPQLVNKILPAVAAVVLDRAIDVRELALQAMELILTQLRGDHKKMAEIEASKMKNSTSNTGSKGPPSSSQSSNSNNGESDQSNNNSWISWGMSGLSKSLEAATIGSSEEDGTKNTTSSAASVPSAPISSPPPRSASISQAKSGAMNNSMHHDLNKIKQNSTESLPRDDDGDWNDVNGLDDDDLDLDLDSDNDPDNNNPTDQHRSGDGWDDNDDDDDDGADGWSGSGTSNVIIANRSFNSPTKSRTPPKLGGGGDPFAKMLTPVKKKNGSSPTLEKSDVRAGATLGLSVASSSRSKTAIGVSSSAKKSGGLKMGAALAVKEKDKGKETKIKKLKVESSDDWDNF